jgi:hypothetical protein
MDMTIVGTGPNGEQVIDGAFLCHMVDTYGLGVAEYSQLLRARGMGFTMRGFIEEGLRRNWDPEQIINKLLDNAPAELSRETVEWLMLKILREQSA